MQISVSCAKFLAIILDRGGGGAEELKCRLFFGVIHFLIPTI